VNSLLQGTDPNDDSYHNQYYPSIAMSLAQSEAKNGEDRPTRETGRFEILISETEPKGAPEISKTYKPVTSIGKQAQI